MMFGKKQIKNAVGLDIGSRSIKAVEIKARNKHGKNIFELKSIGYEPLPYDAIVEGTIIDTTAVAETIKIVFDENKITNKNVVISISGNSVIIKKISLPNMETEELAESIIWEAKHNIPYPYEETNVDYAILKQSVPAKEQNLDILLVAAKKDKIANYSNAVKQARKNLTAIDVDVFALLNSFEINYPESFKEKIVAIINIGSNLTNLVIIENGHPQLFRDLNIGGALFAENISKELNIGFDESEKLIKGIPVEQISQEQFQYVIDMNLQNILEEIKKTFSFYEAGEKMDRKIETIYISGGLSKLSNLSGHIEQKVGIKTEIFNPFRMIEYNENKFDSLYFEDMAALFGIATGLAARSAGS